MRLQIQTSVVAYRPLWSEAGMARSWATVLCRDLKVAISIGDTVDPVAGASRKRGVERRQRHLKRHHDVTISEIPRLCALGKRPES
jgi:hypothetical protein